MASIGKYVWDNVRKKKVNTAQAHRLIMPILRATIGGITKLLIGNYKHGNKLLRQVNGHAKGSVDFRVQDTRGG